MSDKTEKKDVRAGRMFQVSADRHSPSRKVRYIEGSQPDEKGCRMCTPK
ncbi:hypothetical protein [Salinibius halmophilus]|nr:hypothetical protein [Salinibius halmophilus]